MKLFLICLVVLLSSAGAFGAEPPQDKEPAKKSKPKYTIGKETTFITGPLDKDGNIDYVAALNERLSKGVTPENNANVLVWKAIGPKPEGKLISEEFFKTLGMERPPEEGDYFLDQFKFLRRNLNIELEKVFDVERQMEVAFKRPWTKKDFPDLAKWLTINEKPLALVGEAASRSEFFSTYGISSSGAERVSVQASVAVHLQKIRLVSRALICRAMLHAGEAKFDEAWQELLAVDRLARLIARRGTIVDLLVAYALHQNVTDADLVLVEKWNFDAKRIRQSSDAVRALPPFTNPSNAIDLAERFTILELAITAHRPEKFQILSLQLSLREAWSSSFPEYFDRIKALALKSKNPDNEISSLFDEIDLDPILREVNAKSDRLVAALREPARESREKQLAAFGSDIQRLVADIPKADDLAKALVSVKSAPAAKAKLLRGLLILAGPFEAGRKLQQSADRAEQTQSNLFVAFALAAYYRDHGKYPTVLDALAPKYLTKIPNDLFSGKALIYRPNETGYLLYSVGPNGKDDGGRQRGEGPDVDDLRVWMPIDPPVKK